MKYEYVKVEDGYVIVRDDDFEYKIDPVSKYLRRIEYRDDYDTTKLTDTFTIPSVFETQMPDGSTEKYHIDSLGRCVFDRCTCQTMIISDDIKQIDSEAFKNSLIFHVKWPKSCDHISAECFSGSYVESISGIESILEIDNSAFYNARYLESIDLPKGLIQIGANAFKRCKNLSRLILPSTIINIKEGAFSSSGVENIIWPAGCDSIPNYAFEGCKSLVSILGIQHVSEIGSSAFSGCQKLRIIEWPEGCHKVPSKCFSGCWSLKDITLPDTVKIICTGAFEKTQVSSFRWPSKCKKIPTACFSDCSSLKDISLPDSIKEIGTRAFENTAIENFKWPSCCKKIPLYCFSKSSVKTISGIEDVDEVGSGAFSFCRKLKSLSWPQKCHFVGSGVFMECASLNDLQGIGTVNAIAENAFAKTGFSPLNPLDLSCSAVSRISKSAFIGLTIDSVKPPYFVSDDEFKSAFPAP